MTEHLFFAIVRISDGKVVYQGESDWTAAKMLVPGTVHGMGYTPKMALRKARDVARKVAA